MFVSASDAKTLGYIFSILHLVESNLSSLEIDSNSMTLYYALKLILFVCWSWMLLCNFAICWIYGKCNDVIAGFVLAFPYINRIRYSPYEFQKYFLCAPIQALTHGTFVILETHSTHF